MKRLEERNLAILNLRLCIHGSECTYQCKLGYAEYLKNQRFTFIELEESLRQLKRRSLMTKTEVEHATSILNLLNVIQLAEIDKEILEVFSGVECSFDKQYFDSYELEQSNRLANVKLPSLRLTFAEISTLQSFNKKVDYFDFLAAVGFKELVDMDLCFFHKDPFDMTLDEFRYFLMYSIGDSRFAIYFREEIKKKNPELSHIYCFVHEEVMIDSYLDLQPLLEKFCIRLSFEEYDYLRD